jgi:hypothetical protein
MLTLVRRGRNGMCAAATAPRALLCHATATAIPFRRYYFTATVSFRRYYFTATVCHPSQAPDEGDDGEAGEEKQSDPLNGKVYMPLPHANLRRAMLW